MTSSCNCPISWPTQTLFSVMSRSRPWDVAENVNQNLQGNAFCEWRPILIIVSITNHDLCVLVDTRGSELNKFRYSSRGHTFENDSWINYLYINKQTNKQKEKNRGMCSFLFNKGYIFKAKDRAFSECRTKVEKRNPERVRWAHLEWWCSKCLFHQIQ